MIVIGGGDTSTDCVGTSLRHGCKSLLQLEIVPRPPVGRAADNPWPMWPKIYRLDYGQEEAKALFGDDPRQYCIQTTKFVGDGAGHLKAIYTNRVEWVNDNGRTVPRNLPGSEQVFPAQLVLLAMGFSGPENQLLDQLGVEEDARTNARTEQGKYSTSVEGVFAAGDMRRGQSLVVWAINEDRGAARELDGYLMSQSTQRHPSRAAGVPSVGARRCGSEQDWSAEMPRPTVSWRGGPAGFGGTSCLVRQGVERQPAR